MDSNNEILKQEALTFLNGHKKMVLTILDEDSAPNSSLMLYAVDDDFNVFFGTRKCFGKYAALGSNKKVSLAVVQENIDPLQVVDMQGVAEEIPEDKMEETLQWFTSKNDAKYYVKGAEDFAMFKISPKGVRWLDATSGELQINDIEL